MVGRQRGLHPGQLLVSVGDQFDLGFGHRRQCGLGQPDFELDRGFGRIDAEIGLGGMPHVVGHEGEQREHHRGGKAVPQHIA